LPSVLSQQVILTLIYSAGLRVGEVVRLKKKDIDPDRHVIHIRQGKGKKDRYTVLSHVAYELLTQYMVKESINVYLFPGEDGANSSITECSIQYMFEEPNEPPAFQN